MVRVTSSLGSLQFCIDFGLGRNGKDKPNPNIIRTGQRVCMAVLLWRSSITVAPRNLHGSYMNWNNQRLVSESLLPSTLPFSEILKESGINVANAARRMASEPDRAECGDMQRPTAKQLTATVIHNIVGSEDYWWLRVCLKCERPTHPRRWSLTHAVS